MSSARPRFRAAAARSRWTRIVALGAVVAAWPALASAESVVLLTPRGDDALAAERARAQRVLSEALGAQAVTVITRGEAVADLTASAGARCDAIDCAAELLRACDADLAAAVALWSSGDPPTPGAVFVTLVDRRGDRYPGKARVQRGGASDLARAVQDALLDARALQLLGPGPWLRVRGKPEGAEVMINGKPVGTLPYRAPVESGRHTLEVRSDGHKAHVQTIDVPRSAARQIELEIDLPPREVDGPEVAADAAESEPEPDAEPEPEASESGGSGPVVGPLILGGVGAALIGVDVALVLASGCDRRNSLGHCEEGGEIDETRAVIWAGVGAAAVVGAVLWHVIGSQSAPREVAFNAGPNGATVTLSGDF